MIPPITAIRLTGASRRDELPLLVLGPSLGTSASELWATCARDHGLTDAFDVVAWDLPGHGHNRSVPEEGFDVAELAAGVLAIVDDIQQQRGDAGEPFGYAGDSVGGAVGLSLLLEHPERLNGAVLLCTAARFGEPATWQERIEQVRRHGTRGVVSGSAKRWFGHDFIHHDPATSVGLTEALRMTKDAGYIAVCEALATFDVRDRLDEIEGRVLVVGGTDDAATPLDSQRELADRIRGAELRVLDGVGHLAPAEAPERTAELIRCQLLGEPGSAAEEATAASGPEFRQVSYLKATAEQAWQALTDPALSRRCFGGGGPHSTWEQDAPVGWQMDASDTVHDWDQRVLAAKPGRLLSYTWHNYQPEMQPIFGWSDEELARLRTEPISRVRFELDEPAPSVTRLTFVHDEFVPGSQMLAGVAEGWPAILSDLKSLVETGSPVTPGA